MPANFDRFLLCQIARGILSSCQRLHLFYLPPTAASSTLLSPPTTASSTLLLSTAYCSIFYTSSIYHLLQRLLRPLQHLLYLFYLPSNCCVSCLFVFQICTCSCIFQVLLLCVCFILCVQLSSSLWSFCDKSEDRVTLTRKCLPVSHVFSYFPILLYFVRY